MNDCNNKCNFLKNRKIIFITIVLFFILIVILWGNYNSSSTNTSEVYILKNNENYNDINLTTKGYKNLSGNISIKAPRENTVMDYNTYYGNMISLLTNGDSSYELLDAIQEIVNEDNYMVWKENDIFEGVERLYFYTVLGERIREKNKFNNMEVYLQQLIEETYRNGYFLCDDIYKNIDCYDRAEALSIKLSHTMQTLYMCQVYDLINEIDCQETIEWLISQNSKTENIIDKYYIYNSLNYVSYIKDNQININFANTKTNNCDLVQLDAYIYMAKEYNYVLTEESLDQTKNKIFKIINNIDISDLKSIYYALNIAKNINLKIDDEILVNINNLLDIYKYDNNLFPNISLYNSDNKQLLIYYQILSCLGEDVDINKLYNQLDLNYKDVDVFDLYAITEITNYSREKNNDIKKILIKKLESSGINEISAINYMVKGLQNCGYNIKKRDMSSEIIEYYRELCVNADINYSLEDLMLIDSLFGKGIVKDESNICKKLNNTEIDENAELAPIQIYYKYNILMKAGFNIDTIRAQSEILKYRCNGGFKIKLSKEFFDVQATYMLMDLLGKLEHYSDERK